MLKHEEMQWLSNDGLQIFARKWEPEGEIKAVINLVHGIGEHSGRYQRWAEQLTGAGYAVMTFDLRGHGNSGGLRGHVSTFDHYADDVSLLLENTSKQFPGKPCFLYGISLGGIIVLYYLIQRQPQISGAIVTSVGLHSPIAEQKLKVFLARLLGSIWSSGSLPSGLEPDTICRDQKVVEAYLSDPLVHDRVSFGFGKSVLQAIEYVFDNVSRINLPLLLMHGTADQLAYPSGTQTIADSVTCDCATKLFEGLSHELHNEPEKEEVFEYLREWLDQKL
jgi:alpha-beta hydrolase superfamily lysophospholipase